MIWQNQACSTSRNALALLRERGFDPDIVLYLENPPSEADIRAVLREAEMSARELLRVRAAPYEELGLESAALSDFLTQIKPGTPVLVVSYGAASTYLTPAAIEGLRTLGADVTIETLRDQYFALIGVKGAAPGSVALQVDANEAFLRISLERDRRALAGVVDGCAGSKT